MTKQAHTATPWKKFEDTIWTEDGLTQRILEDVPSKANAEFIVLAVNNHENLIADNKRLVGTAQNAHEIKSRLEVQNKKLLEACREAKFHLNVLKEENNLAVKGLILKLEQAIAKCEKEAV